MWLVFPSLYWYLTKDGDPIAKAIFDRHYSRRFYADGRQPKLFVGPGQKMVLLAHNHDALFVWRKFKSDDGQEGVNCAVFRNESQCLSSDMILEAERIAHGIRWYGERLFTYVKSSAIKSSNPGYCFIKAGWKKCGITKHAKLVILEKCPTQE